ncbi:MAG: DUF3833 domain-containing protein [Arcobacter sp.]|uniref:DUF3833 domain-containing protein n=1 Tax=Arcobacter sp. TaxID=1872629 RepID=UPI003C777048
MKFIKYTLLIVLTILITGCTSMKMSDFKDTKPVFIPKDYFKGDLKAYGIVKDMGGKIIKSFKADMHGSWDKNGVGTLDEKFVYSDGTKQTRIWTLTPQKDGTYIGTASDIVGDAVLSSLGNTVMMDYTMRVPYGSGTLDINVKDWLHLQEDGIIINHSKMKKFGFTVGELVITIIKQ